MEEACKEAHMELAISLDVHAKYGELKTKVSILKRQDKSEN